MFDRKKAAIVAGVSLLVMVAISIVGAGIIHGNLFGSGDVMDSYQKVMANPGMVNADIFIWLVVLILDIVVAWALYVFFMDANKHVSLLTGWLRIIYAAMLGTGLMSMVSISMIASDPALSGMENAASQIAIFSKTFDGFWAVALIVFGLHLLFVGILCVKATYVPTWLAVIVLIAAVGYLIVQPMLAFFPSIENVTKVIELVLMVPMTLGELLLAIWLLAKGQKV